MTEYLQHQGNMKSVLNAVNEAIHELNQAREQAAQAQVSANPEQRQHAWHKLEQAERRAEEAREQLLSQNDHESLAQQVRQNLQELENAMFNARQF